MFAESKESRSTILGRGHIEILSFLQRAAQGNPVHVVHITKFFSKSNETKEFWRRLNELTELGAVKLIATSNGKFYRLNPDFQILIEDTDGKDEMVTLKQAALLNSIANPLFPTEGVDGAVTSKEMMQQGHSINTFAELISQSIVKAVGGDKFGIEKKYLPITQLDENEIHILRKLREYYGNDQWRISGINIEGGRNIFGEEVLGGDFRDKAWNSMIRKGVVIFDQSTGLYSLHPKSNHNLEA